MILINLETKYRFLLKYLYEKILQIKIKKNLNNFLSAGIGGSNSEDSGVLGIGIWNLKGVGIAVGGNEKISAGLDFHSFPEPPDDRDRRAFRYNCEAHRLPLAGILAI